MTGSGNKYPRKPDNNQFRQYAKYTGLMAQWIVIILLGAYGGHWLDGFVGWPYPIFTLVLSLLAIFIVLYFFIRDVLG